MYKPIDEAYAVIDRRRVISRANDDLIALMLDSLRAGEYDRKAILAPMTHGQRRLVEEFLLSFTSSALDGARATEKRALTHSIVARMTHS